MTYEEAIAFIHDAHWDGEKDGLSNMYRLMERMGNPHRKFSSLHVGGTNGKGSVCAFLQSVLLVSGYRVGLYTSPFLQRYNERIQIDGIPIPDDVLAERMTYVASVVEGLRAQGVHPTEFEIGTALALYCFAQERVDIAIVEVGLGGRLDPTNVIMPLAAMIAAIGMDHMHILGNTLRDIAIEKAGIAKLGVPMIVSAQNTIEIQAAIQEQCDAVGASFYIARPSVGFELGLEGEHQAYNAGLATAGLSELIRNGFDRISEKTLREGLQETTWPGRLEWVEGSPRILLDGAHNTQGAQALADYVSGLPAQRTILLCGIVRDKEYEEIAAILAAFSDVVIALPIHNPRALPPVELAEVFVSLEMETEAATDIHGGLHRARELAGETGRIVVAGSLYLIGEVRSALQDEVWQ